MIWIWIAAGIAGLYALGNASSSPAAAIARKPAPKPLPPGPTMVDQLGRIVPIPLEWERHLPTNPAGVTDASPIQKATGPRVDLINAAFLQYAARYPRNDELQYWQTTRADLTIAQLNAAIRAALVPGTPIAAPAVVAPPPVPATPTRPPPVPAPTGRWKFDPKRDPPCYWDANDSGPNQCAG